MHSLKGICAIAGVPPAEQLAHAVEDLLRGLTKREIDYSASMLDLLHAAVERLIKIIAAHRKGRPLPDVAALLPRLAAYLPAVVTPSAAALPPPPPPPSASPPSAPDPVAAAPARGLKIWRVIFIPSAELDQRGVKINTVRERLARLGEIIQRATPSVQPSADSGSSSCSAPPAKVGDLAVWQQDGVTFEPVGGSAPVPAPALAPPHHERTGQHPAGRPRRTRPTPRWV